MSEFTKGPWVIAEAGFGRGEDFIVDEIYVCRDGDDVAICADITDPVTGELSIANARLISAAPDLLEALQKISNRLEVFIGDERDMPEASMEVCLGYARAAIAKAKGETK